MSFLKAEWRKLALVNYEVDPSILEAHIPYSTELDLWNGRCYLSLVGFMFKNTRLLGVKVPFHIDFEEVNLRFYVTHQKSDELRRGVVFIKEIVPKPALTLVANTVYKEHYQTLPMKHLWRSENEKLFTQYSWKTGNGWNQIALTSEKEALDIPENSEEEFITEHYWGYTQIGPHKTFEYQVTHPRWQHYPVIDLDMNVDFARTYGSKFEFLNGQKPASVLLAEGSAITVEARRKL